MGQPESRTAAGRLPFGVNLAGCFRSEKGLGEAARAALRSLRRANIPLALNDFHDPGSANLDTTAGRFSATNPFGINLVHVNVDALPTFAGERGEDYFRGRYNIGYWFWELPEFPAAWEDRFRRFDEVWVSTDFTLAAVSRAAPVPVVKIPLALSPPPRGRLGRSHFGLPADPFLFLFVFDLHSYLPRKNPLGLIRAFRAAFGDRGDAVLVLKCAHAASRPKDFRALTRAAAGANVRVIDGVFTREETTALMRACDCYVSLHRSEGFGLTLAEAMLLGKPVIATGYSGNRDFMTPANSLAVNFRLTRLARDYGPYKRGSTWAEPDLAHAAELMRRVFEDRDAGRRLGRQARKDVAGWYSPEAAAEAVRSRLAALARQGKIPAPPWLPKPAPRPHAVADYPAFCRRLRAAVEAAVPEGAVVLVAGKGDPALAQFTGRVGWHFPRDPGTGGYAGFHPKDDADARDRVKALRRDGATHFLLPATMGWWRTHYRRFVASLRRRRVLINDPALGLLVELAPAGPEPAPLSAPARPTGPPRCRIVVPVRNHSALTRQCLEAVFRTAAGAEVVVVDDGSTDDTPAVLAGFGGRVRTVRRAGTGGFAAACNDGAAGAAAEFLVFLNNDTVPEAGWLDALVREAEAHPGAGVVGAKLLYLDRTVQHAGMAVGQHRHPFHIYVGFPAAHPAVNKPREFPMVTGACVLVRRALFEAVGGFDTGYRNSYEDVDLCLKARAAGAAVRYCPASVVVHLESATRGADPARAERDRVNGQRFQERWGAELVPDDVRYYLEDGLLGFDYRDQGYVTLAVSPLLGRVVPAG